MELFSRQNMKMQVMMIFWGHGVGLTLALERTSGLSEGRTGDYNSLEGDCDSLEGLGKREGGEKKRGERKKK